VAAHRTRAASTDVVPTVPTVSTVPAVPTTAATRLLQVLGAFSAELPALGLTEIAAQTGLPKSTVHRLVAELVDWGALERGSDRRYRIGLRVWELGTLAPRGRGLGDVAAPFLEDIRTATGQNALLGVLDGTETVYVQQLSGRGAIPMKIRVGSRLPVHATGVGLALLASSPVALREEVLASPLRRYTDRTVVDPRELRRILAEVRRRGYAVSDRQVERIGMSVAAPVFDAAGVAAALSVVMPSGSDLRRFAPVVVAASRGLTRALGGG
jgi:DNA-binding IclR family transcriptional regulator